MVKRSIVSLSLGVALAAQAARVPVARAEPILPTEPPALAALRGGYERLEDTFVTRENGLFLDPIAQPPHVATIEAFFAQSAELDFAAFSGLHPFEVLADYDEHGDEGNFAGIASVGVAARLLYLRQAGAPAAEIARARDAAVRAARAWHAYGAIGGPGIVARGVRRVTPAAGDPPFPGTPPELVPLQDSGGSPLPVDKVAVWRAPVASGFDGWIWFDDTSKDQVSGYALAVAWLWDALSGDPEVDPQLLEDLAVGLGAFAHALMEVAPEVGVDLCIRDADGRLTRHFDLNPRLLGPDGIPLPEGGLLKNGFNSLLALGIIRTAYHVTGDPEIGRYYYEELIGRRRMAEDPTTTVAAMYLGAPTNYSNVNMAAIGLASLGRFESDPYVLAQLETTLSTQFWDAGSDRDASHVEQAWFDAVYGSYSAAAPRAISGRVENNLAGFPAAPCFERDRINCDEQEIAAKQCVAVDGVTAIEVMDGVGHNGQPVARDWLPMSIRPDSDFVWRSDPHTVNGSASTRMDPRGDWLAAYWLARLSELGDPEANRSPFARPALPYTLGEGEGGAGGGGGGAAPSAPAAGDEGCSCRAAGSTGAPLPSGGILWVLAALAAVGRSSRGSVRASTS